MHIKDMLRRNPAAAERSVPLEEYLTSWDSEPQFKATAAGRIVRAIGKPTVIDTSRDQRLGRIFSNRTIYTYGCFKELFGIEEPLRSIVHFLECAAEGLEQSKQILYLYGPVGSGKSKIVEILKRLAEEEPIPVLAVRVGDTLVRSPVLENPLGLFDATRHGAYLEEQYRIPVSRLDTPMSRWALQQLELHDGDLSKFAVVMVKPSMVARAGVARVEPGDDATSDVSLLIGKADREGKTEGYQYSGGLNRTTQGLLEFFEMFKARDSLLNPLISATQDRKYAGMGDVGELPYQGIVVAHSNPVEWDAFRDDKLNAGLIDRICPIQVPYCVRITEEQSLYRRYLDGSEFRAMPCSPGVLEIPARFAVGSRIHDKDRQLRLRLYDGRSTRGLEIDEKMQKVTADDLRKEAEWQEGMEGVPTRFILKFLPMAATADAEETGLDPAIMYETLHQILVRDGSPGIGDDDPVDILEREVYPWVRQHLSYAIQRAFIENYETFTAERFATYVSYLDAWIDDKEYKEPETGTIRDGQWLAEQLNAFEKGIEKGRTKDFRNDVFNKVLRHQADASKRGEPMWKAIDPFLWQQFEKNMLPSKAEMLPIIGFDKKSEAKIEEQHTGFLERLTKLGYTMRQARRITEWYIKNVRD